MGGSGAKARRQLKRDTVDSSPKSGSNSKEDEKKYQKGQYDNHGKFTSMRSNGNKSAFGPRNGPSMRPNGNKSGIDPRKGPPSLKKAHPGKDKTKVKKPKHLKRKLESADDEISRAKILAELTEFERKKALFSTPKPSEDKDRPKKIQKTSQWNMVDSSNSLKNVTVSDNRFESKSVSLGSVVPGDKTDISNDGGTEGLAAKSERRKRRRGRKDTLSNVPWSEKANINPTEALQPPATTRNNSQIMLDSQKNEKVISRFEPAPDKVQAKENKSDQRTSPVKDDVPCEKLPDLEKNSKNSDSSESSDDSSDNDSSESDSSQAKKKLTVAKVEDAAINSGDASNTANDDSDDDNSDDDIPGIDSTRKRGKRRKGRKDTSEKVEETKTASEPTGTSPDPSEATSDKPKDNGTEQSKESKIRRCIGRRPVTDFIIGQQYSGKVVYVKPFGVFLDIMCHSDAFCHVSRVSDDYVESIEAFLKEGDEVKARVVEINRKQKRITVSMQSEKRIQDEIASLEARNQRLERRKLKKLGKKQKSGKENQNGTSLSKKSHLELSDTSVNRIAHEQKINTIANEPRINRIANESRINRIANEPSVNRIANVVIGEKAKKEAEMTPAELKRARKLARRAERRAKND